MTLSSFYLLFFYLTYKICVKKKKKNLSKRLLSFILWAYKQYAISDIYNKPNYYSLYKPMIVEKNFSAIIGTNTSICKYNWLLNSVNFFFSSVYCFCYSLGIMHCRYILWCLNSEMCNSEHFKSIFWDILITFTMKLNTHLDLVLSVIHKKLKCRKCDHTDSSEILKLNKLWIHHKPRT